VHQVHRVGVVIDNQDTGKAPSQGEIAAGGGLRVERVNRGNFSDRFHDPLIAKSLLQGTSFRKFDSATMPDFVVNSAIFFAFPISEFLLTKLQITWLTIESRGLRFFSREDHCRVHSFSVFGAIRKPLPTRFGRSSMDRRHSRPGRILPRRASNKDMLECYIAVTAK
jgi:hypothetical protein